ncbi:MAG: ATP synthase F1 subunit gamma [Ignavibacteriota bacterium]|mgnify:CR=1 FL=1|jgi:F-type H+-transporting ATPase subunit gamma|nr:ATP synthase F1 subunit gamma [Ignavibacteriota bacterium]MBW7841266.1 ATP synthase F1 subunit gamma [Ignavibacterium sp.]MCO6448879.1 ATP synthase F1 subunit gamma [Ignavibacterium album]MCZ2269495.1 ATP synthase F1 subunit gamma [Ignavibacteriales bacterium]MDX9710993.1 ATP synthase F1 subunit gamma [Ignavibacteriaceae bacterium]
MATLRDIKLRIKGVKSTQQITKAMKMVAAAKLRRATESILNARPYSKKISTLLSHLVTEEDRGLNPLFYQREVSNVAIVVVTADRGLCGAFNTNIIKEAARYIEEEVKSPNENYLLYCLGKKGSDYFSKRNYNIGKTFPGIFSQLNYAVAQNLVNELIEKYLDGTIDRVILIFNEFKSIIQQKIVVEQFLPIVPPEKDNSGNYETANYILEPDQKSIFNYLVPKHLKAQMWRVLLESNASEFAARMTAMDNATTNAKELIRTLSLTYNSKRQAAITTEILEIVSGANALKEN